ncbi:hypothetical protein [Nocardia paucivorans]|uniref:hypothetical protein n=1 Tax=Nocardia paucivorans TaxID=114259 RepID=UPI00031075D2|nr:hypothetical protein [Nocardia paucivorans]
MIAMTETADIDVHRLELEAMPSKAAQVRYAAGVLGPDASRPDVRDWLAGFGIAVPKSTLYENVAKVQGERVPGTGPDTRDLPKLTDERLAALEAEFSRTEEAADAPAVPRPEPAETDPAASLVAGPDPSAGRGESGPESGSGGPVVGDSGRTEASESGSGPELESGPGPDESGSPVQGPDESGSESGSPVQGPDESGSESGSPVQGPDESGSESGSPVRSPDGPGPEVRPESGPGAVRTPTRPGGKLVVWPVLLMALSAFVAVWSGWVGLGEMTGFGVVKPFPGVVDDVEINTSIVLPIGVEAYAGYAMYVWLSGRCRLERTKEFAKWSSLFALLLGSMGQIAYHLLEQSNATKKSEAQKMADAVAEATGQKAAEVVIHAPWWITMFVSFLPVIVVGLGLALAHMVKAENDLADAEERATAGG